MKKILLGCKKNCDLHSVILLLCKKYCSFFEKYFPDERSIAPCKEKYFSGWGRMRNCKEKSSQFGEVSTWTSWTKKCHSRQHSRSVPQFNQQIYCRAFKPDVKIKLLLFVALKYYWEVTFIFPQRATRSTKHNSVPKHSTSTKEENTIPNEANQRANLCTLTIPFLSITTPTKSPTKKTKKACPFFGDGEKKGTTRNRTTHVNRGMVTFATGEYEDYEYI